MLPITRSKTILSAAASALLLITANSNLNAATVPQVKPQGTAAGATISSLYNSASETAFAQYSNMPPVQGPGGVVYGVMATGGSSSLGSLYTVGTDSTVITVLDFATTTLQHPGALVLGADGNFYGTALNSTLDGVLYKFAPGTGALTLLCTFPNSAIPQGPLTLGPNGLIYGTAVLASNSGSIIFFYDPALKKFGTVYTFATGILAQSGVQLSAGLAFYGVVGDSACGHIFEIAQTGAAVDVHDFNCLTEGQVNPGAGLLLAPDGNFYGVLNASVLINGGLFRYVPGGKFILLHTFSILSDGIGPSPLTLGGDGNLYGFTQLQALNLSGEAFTYNLSKGIFTDLAAIPSGLVGAAGGVEGLDGNIYITSGGLSISALGQSNILKLSLPVALPVSVDVTANALSGLVGANITISNTLAGALQPLAPVCEALGAWTGALADTASTVIKLPSVPGTYRYDVLCIGIGIGGIGITVDPLPATTTNLQASSTSLLPSQSVTFTSGVTSANDPIAPTGTVSFYDGQTKIGSAPLQSDGQASFTHTAAGVTPGTYAIHSYYPGDGLHQASTSGVVRVTVRPRITTATELTAPSIVIKPNSATLTAAVSMPGDTNTSDPAPGGTVTFSVGTLVLGKATVSNGKASITASSAGVHATTYTVVSTYSGNQDHLGSSASTKVVVKDASKNASTTTLTVPSNVPRGSKVTLSVTVTGSGPVPTGTVKLYASLRGNTTYLGSMTLSHGSAEETYQTSTKDPSGTYDVDAVYSGDANYNPSTSTQHMVVHD